MLIEFTAGNFRSIRKPQTLSLVASSTVSKDKSVDDNNVFVSNEIRLLKSVVIYGANGSGKSNLIKAFLAMARFIFESFSNPNLIDLVFQPFLLDNFSKNKPSFFQIVFIADNKRYRYGFEIKKGKVVSEWLFGPASKNEVFYFTRELQKINVNNASFPEGKGLESGKTRDTTLFLNVTEAFDGTISKSIKNFFSSNIAISSGINDEGFKQLTMSLLNKAKFKKDLLDLLRLADLEFVDINKIELEPEFVETGNDNDKKNKNDKIELLLSKHNIKTKNGKDFVELEQPFDSFESEGTKKFFSYAGVILTSLKNGKILIVDELDSRLHPLITKKIIQLYNSKETNKNNAQLIFVTHDTNLLDATLFRRDQIYFSEKNKAGESIYYSLVNISGVRNDASYEKDYIKGKYGAVPFLGKNNNIFS